MIPPGTRTWGRAGFVLLALSFAPPADAAGRTHTVEVRGMAYAPAVVRVAVGDTVVWSNADIVPHTVTHAGRVFDSGDLQPGASWRWRVDQAGRLPYICLYHPTMQGLVVAE